MTKLVRSNKLKNFSDIKRLFAERNEALQCFCASGNPHFWGYTEKELKEHLSDHLQETEYDASLALLAAIEAAFRFDFDYRRKKRLKDSRSKEIRRLSKLPKRNSYEISINKIFGTLKIDQAVPNHTITLLNNYFKYRNWLAHGRYWNLNRGANKPTFLEIYQLAQAIENVLYRD
jgi:hypothetical protein